jgi:hypothetical protein
LERGKFAVLKKFRGRVLFISLCTWEQELGRGQTDAYRIDNEMCGGALQTSFVESVQAVINVQGK